MSSDLYKFELPVRFSSSDSYWSSEYMNLNFRGDEN